MSALDVVGRLLLATLLGGLVGFERERHGRAAGLRTHILVCTASALLMLLNLYLFELYLTRTDHIDPSRIAAQVVSGIGFLGAGTILRFRASVRGLTTAASLWAVAGVGLSVGAGFTLGAVVATALFLLVLELLTRLEWRLVRKDWYRTLVIETTTASAEVLQQARDVLGNYQIELRDLVIQRAGASERLRIELEVKVSAHFRDDQVLVDLMRLSGVEGARWR